MVFKIIVGYVVLGGNVGDLYLGVFGFYCFQSYLMSFEEVVFVFIDCMFIDMNYVGNDCNDVGSLWEVVNIGIGVYMYEIGYFFGLLYQESGVMLRDYVMLNCMFVFCEVYLI